MSNRSPRTIDYHLVEALKGVFTTLWTIVGLSWKVSEGKSARLSKTPMSNPLIGARILDGFAKKKIRTLV